MHSSLTGDTLTLYSDRASRAVCAAEEQEFGALLHLAGCDVVSVEIPRASLLGAFWFSSTLRAQLPADLAGAIDLWVLAALPAPLLFAPRHGRSTRHARCEAC